MKIKQILYLMSFCLLLSATTFAQQVQEFTVSGTVVDKDKLSMPGVSVYIKDKPSKGTTTDNDGNFKLKVVYGDKMIFSFIGFKPSEHVAIKPQTDLTVTLLEDNNSLDEVVVVALGNVQRKISSVGAITTVSTKDIQSPSPSISNLLGGRAAGVISLQSSGEPGQNIADFWVRGIGTFGANSSALVLIDGRPCRCRKFLHPERRVGNCRVRSKGSQRSRIGQHQERPFGQNSDYRTFQHHAVRPQPSAEISGSL